MDKILQDHCQIYMAINWDALYVPCASNEFSKVVKMEWRNWSYRLKLYQAVHNFQKYVVKRCDYRDLEYILIGCWSKQ